MDNPRTILWALFAGMVFITWTQWQSDHAVTVTEEISTSVVTGDIEQDIDLPVPVAAPGNIETQDSSAGMAQQRIAVESQGQIIKVSTDFLNVEISTLGGSLVNATLPKYPQHKDHPDIPVQLLSNVPGDEYIIGSGLVDANRNGPTHLAVLESLADNYTLSEGEDELRVPLTWNDGSGVVVEKTFIFKRGRYDVGVEYRLTNNSGDTWRGLSYVQIRRVNRPVERSMFNVDTYSYDGAVIYDGDKYEKIDPEDMADEPVDLAVAGGWIAFIQHHFLTAAVPTVDQVYTYDGKYTQGIITLRGSGPAVSIQPGETRTLNASFFIGPKLQDQLAETAEGLPLTVDYGLLAIVSQPLFWLLGQVHNFIGNWGWSIILVTFLIKLTFYKLTETSGRSMAKMRKLQPRLKALQERYKDDRQALSQQMMELYKREKVNPAAGCLPMLIQIPFFIAFYWVLLESVEMRQAPFMLWITDLSSRDPYFVLPLLMGIAMFVQQKLNPAPPDPIQAKVMQILPVIFTVFFAFFPAGLVLYWLTNSVLSVAQQWNINRRMGAEG
jgi:YidC/Oxa1 family membrane protein insertase